MVDKKVTNSIKESFEKYLGNNGKAYIEKETMKSYDIINAIKNSGGVAILAHPACIEDDKIVEDIIKEGIDGLEIINSKHSLNDIIKYYKICNKYQLIQTCGSDCHGNNKNFNMLIGKYNMNKKNISRIYALHKLRVN